MLTWPWRWNGRSPHQSSSTQLAWPKCQIDPWQWPALFLWTKQFCFDHRNSDVLLMNISPSMSVLLAGEYLTVFVFRSRGFAFGLLDLNPSSYLLPEKCFFFSTAYNPHLYPNMGDWQYFRIVANNITSHSNLNTSLNLSPSCVLTWCPRLIMECVIPKDGFQPKRKPLFLCSVLTYPYVSCSTEICSVWVAGKRHFNVHAYNIIVFYIVIAIHIWTRGKYTFVVITTRSE